MRYIRIVSSQAALSKRTIPLIITALLFAGLTACEKELYRDESGIYHGTGTKVYTYDSGTPKRVDRYTASRLTDSIWYKPNGDVVAETVWDKEGNGLDYYLNDNGVVIKKTEVVGGTWHGDSWHYDEHGNLTKVVQYVDGVPEE